MKERLSGDDDGLGGLHRQGGAWLPPHNEARLTDHARAHDERRAPIKETQIP
jgi:hypothetical protein